MSSSIIESLSEQNQARVATILESCLFALEHGERLSPEELIEAHPDLAEPLGKCLTTLMTLHAAVHGEAAPTDGDLPEPGMRLGDFELGSQIGRGGMGVVYRAKQLSLDRSVAIKLLPNSHLLSPSQLRRFTLESRAAAQLQHNNIVPVIAVGHEKTVHYFAMQLIDGCSLEKVDYRTWSSDGCRPLLLAAIDLADALDHAHQSGIIHRDIKPGNLLLDEQGKVWITDFGLAMCRGDARLTMSGDLIGTMNYMSPEQSRAEPVDERTDIYSLGATLYELITGKAAFPGQVRAEVFRAIEFDDPVAPRKLNPSCPYDLETIVLKAMSKNREDRYARASQMREDLQRVRDGQPILGRRPAAWQRAWRWAQRHRGLVAVAAIGLAATCLSITVGAAQVLWTREQLLASQAESQSHLQSAETNYWQGRNLVQRWNKDILGKLADVPGAESLRASMLADTIEYYQAYLDEKRHRAIDPSLAKDVVAARLGLAKALDARGQTEQAIEAYRQSIDELKSIVSSDASAASRLVIAHNDLAVVWLRDGKFEEAKQLLLDALNQSSLLKVDSDDLLAALQTNLARTYQSLGKRDDQLKSLAQAETFYRRAIEHTTIEQDRIAFQSELAAVLDFRALALADDDKPMACELCRQAIALHKACCQAPGASLDWLRRLAASQHNYAVILWEQSEFGEARSQFREAIATKLGIVQRSGLRSGTGTDAATSYLALGRLERHQGQTTAALECFRQARAAVQHELSRRGSTENQLLLAESLAGEFGLTNSEPVRLELGKLMADIPTRPLTEAQAQTLKRLASSQHSLESGQ